MMLKIESLQVKYGDFVAVSDASLEIAGGQIAALIGGNGTGKTSLLNSVAGLLPPSGGRVVFDETDITAMPPDQIVQRGLSLVPQGGRCFLRMSVLDNLLVGSYPAKARRNAKHSMEQVFSLFPALSEKRNALAGTLSGGHRQMLAIGRALMAEPKCLMFDEVSLGLAPVAINDLYARILRINREEGISVILVEQDTERVMQISDVFFVMLKGRVVLSGKRDGINKETIKKAYFGI